MDRLIFCSRPGEAVAGFSGRGCRPVSGSKKGLQFENACFTGIQALYVNWEFAVLHDQDGRIP